MMLCSKRILINQIRHFSDKRLKDVLHDKSNKKFVYFIPGIIFFKLLLDINLCFVFFKDT